MRRPHADHQHAAEQARQMPGQWVLAATYASSASAKDTARRVRTGDGMPAYRPAGAFQARTRITQDGADLWVCHGQPIHQPDADFQASIASGLTEDFQAFSQRLQEAVDPTGKGTPA
jgi:hypothetical protein